MADLATIQDRINARQEAEQVLDLMSSTAEQIMQEHGRSAAEAYWTAIRRYFLDIYERDRKAKATRLSVDPMTNAESREFGDERMPFGKHSGQRIDEVPREYLDWLDGQPDFRRELARYLRSDRIMRED
jgi:uncharacterized protein (DUF3820 family)